MRWLLIFASLIVGVSVLLLLGLAIYDAFVFVYEPDSLIFESVSLLSQWALLLVAGCLLISNSVCLFRVGHGLNSSGSRSSVLGMRVWWFPIWVSRIVGGVFLAVCGWDMFGVLMAGLSQSMFGHGPIAVAWVFLLIVGGCLLVDANYLRGSSAEEDAV